MMTTAVFEHLLRTGISSGTRRAVPAAGLIEAAVLVPVLLHGEEPVLLFTRRTDRVETHKGQISFPGGVVDPEDDDFIATALREAHEELGIPPSAVEPLGLLDDLTTPTGFRITPVVGLLRAPCRYVINTEEVEDVFEAPVSALMRPEICSSEIIVVQGVARQIWSYSFGTHRIWGATALILRNLLSLTATTSPEHL